MAFRDSCARWWSRTAGCQAWARALTAAALLLLGCFASLASAEEVWEYEVKSGETLWAITTRYLKSIQYVQPLQKFNRIERPNTIPPGTRLRIPYDWLRSSVAKARLVSVRGDVRIEPATGSSRPAAPGAELEAGDRLLTSSDANALLEFADGAQLRLNAEGSLRVKSLRTLSSGAGDAQIELERGRTENVVPPRSDRGTRFQIETPAGVTSVRGTQFRVSSGDSIARTEVVGGQVAVDAAGQGVQVDAGFGTRVQAGTPPMPPVALLPAPDLTALPARLEQLPLSLPIAPVQGAVAYRVQLAAATGDALVVDAQLDAPRVDLPELPGGRYQLRVRAIDALGLEGLQSDRALDLDPRPQPPSALEPEPEALIVVPSLAVRWDARDERLTYRVQLAADASFAQPLRDEAPVREPQLRLSDLPPGTYYWRVAGIHPQQGAGAFGEARSFRIALPAPRIDATTMTPAVLRLAWAPVEGADGYEVQLGRDRAFTDLLAMNTVARTSLELPRPAAGRYFVRVRPMDAQGNVGPLESVYDFDVPSPPMPPALLLPASEASFDAGRPEIRWQAQDASRYHLQLAANERFDRLLLERDDVVGDGVRLDAQLPPGRYYWRVASISEAHGRGEFSAARSFRVLVPPPDRLGSKAKGGDLMLSWNGAPSAARYRVQLARNEQFSEPIVDQQVEGLEWRALRPQAGQYYMRVSAVDADGVAGPFSGPHPVKVGPRYPYWLLPIVPLMLVF